MRTLRIKSIKRLTRKNDRYDLTVPTTNNFFANGILIHNTSARFGHVQEMREYIPWYKKPLSWLGMRVRPRSKLVWADCIGTRKVDITDGREDGGFYGSYKLWQDTAREILPKLRKGEVVYGEIVGYVGEKLIMSAQGTKELKNKKISKQYGDEMRYTYGCAPGASDFYVYRIVYTNEDGNIVELSWPQVLARCKELELKTVPTLLEPAFVEFFEGEPYVRMRYSTIKTIVLADGLAEGESTVDSRHIREGVVVRVEGSRGTFALKHKSFDFKVLEGIAKEDDDAVDIEEANSLDEEG